MKGHRHRLQSLLGPEYLVNPQVTVNVREFKSKRIYIYGEVEDPGSYPLMPNMTALEAVIVGGGFTKFANTRTLKILREENGSYVWIKVSLSRILDGKEDKSSMVLEPNDIVIVKKSLF